MLFLILKALGALFIIILSLLMYFSGGDPKNNADEKQPFKLLRIIGSGLFGLLGIIWLFYEICTELGENLGPQPDPRLAIASHEAELPEGDTGTTPFTFIVSRRGNLDVDVSVGYAVAADGMADAADFGGRLPEGRVTIGAGLDQAPITIPVSGDGNPEPNETFKVTLSDPLPDSAMITSDDAMGRILDDDAPPTTEEAWNAAVETGTASAYRQFLVDYPNSPYADRARQALNEHTALIRRLQQRLFDLGYYKGSVDGIVEERLDAAADVFSAEAGVPKPDLDLVQSAAVRGFVERAENAPSPVDSQDAPFYISNLPFVDARTRAPLEAGDKKRVIDRAVEDAMTAYAEITPGVIANDPRYSIPKSRQAATDLSDIYWRDDLDAEEKWSVIVTRLMGERNVSGLVFGEVSFDVRTGLVNLRPKVVSAKGPSMVFEDIAVGEDEIVCSASGDSAARSAQPVMCPPLRETFQNTILSLLRRMER